MKFVELNSGYIRADLIVGIVPPSECEENGDFLIKIYLNNGTILDEPEVSYDFMMKRLVSLIEEVEAGNE